jgi:hypothetical protein
VRRRPSPRLWLPAAGLPEVSTACTNHGSCTFTAQLFACTASTCYDVLCASAGSEAALVAAWCTSTSCTAGSLLQQTSGVPATPAVFMRLSQANLTTLKQPGATPDVQHLTTLHFQKLEAELQLWKVSWPLQQCGCRSIQCSSCSISAPSAGILP